MNLSRAFLRATFERDRVEEHWGYWGYRIWHDVEAGKKGQKGRLGPLKQTPFLDLALCKCIHYKVSKGD